MLRLLKRCFKEAYMSVELYHLFRYLNEEAFRFNEREGEYADRFQKTLRSVAERLLTYSDITGKTMSS